MPRCAEPKLAGSPGSEQSCVTSKVAWEFPSKNDSYCPKAAPLRQAQMKRGVMEKEHG